MKNKNKIVYSQFANHELPARRFYEKYWQCAGGAIPANDPTTPKRMELLLDILKKIVAVEKVLDAGCGSGFFTNLDSHEG